MTPNSMPSPVQNEASANVSNRSPRLSSLDVFRGATIAAMLLVNNPGDWGAVYAPLKHAPWHGWTFTDVIFPFFIWIVGVAVPLSTARRLEQGATRRELLGHAVRRCVIIFTLGLFLNSFGFFIDGSLFRDGISEWLRNYLTTVRIPGVLQRIAIAYLVATAIYLFCSLRARVTWTAALLLGYWALMTLVPVPGHGAGVLEPQGNLSQYVDNAVLNGPVIGTHVYKATKTWDPEGILSTIPAIASCLVGIFVGSLLRTKLTPDTKTSWLFTGSVALMLLGLLLDPLFPINKNIWTSSYTLFMAGLAGTSFAAIYWLIDVQGWKRFTKPFEMFGMNAITIFVLAGIVGRLTLEIKVGSERVALKTWLFTKAFASLPDPKVASLMWALSYVFVFFLIAAFLYRRRWFLKF